MVSHSVSEPRNSKSRRSAKSMRKNAKLAAKELRQVAIFPHNADPHTLRITTVPANAWETILFSDCLLT